MVALPFTLLFLRRSDIVSRMFRFDDSRDYSRVMQASAKGIEYESDMIYYYCYNFIFIPTCTSYSISSPPYISSLPHPTSMIVRCAAGRLCACPGRAPEFRNDGVTPRHRCMNCRKPMCGGGSCGVQWMDNAERARRGFVFPISALHLNGQEEFNQTNNEHVLICFCAGRKRWRSSRTPTTMISWGEFLFWF